MVFCGECGKKVDAADKFCTTCGAKIKPISSPQQMRVFEKVEEITKDEPEPTFSQKTEDIPQPNIKPESIVGKTFEDLEISFEKAVEKIMQNRGYNTEAPFITRGRSGKEYNIDILAEKGDETIIIECNKNEGDKKIGIKELKEFMSALEDLDFGKGLFVTSSGFSSSAIGYTTNNPNLKHVELWDAAKVMSDYMESETQRVELKKIIVDNCLPLKRDTLDMYVTTLLANKERVTVKRSELVFVPYHLVSFHLHEEFNTPDGNVHTQHNEGRYVIDGTTSEILSRSDNKTNTIYNLNSEQKQVIKDLQIIDAQRNVEIVPDGNWKVLKLEPSKNDKDIEFMIKQRIMIDNVHEIKYDVRLAENKKERRQFTHSPTQSSVTVNSSLIYVPRVDVEFSSREYSYSRILLPASEVLLSDEISYCKHPFGKKHTSAVCDVCGIAKCESHIIKGTVGGHYCKKHSPDKVTNQKSDGIAKKIRFPFGKK